MLPVHFTFIIVIKTFDNAERRIYITLAIAFYNSYFKMFAFVVNLMNYNMFGYDQ